MLVLAYFRHRGPAWPDEIIRALGLGEELVAQLCRDLEAAGMLEPTAGH
jgi:hypothetical protein